MTIFVILVAGLIAGALAGRIVEGHGFGFIGDILIGVAGAFIGGELLPTIDVTYGVWGLILMSTLGAALLLGVTRMVRYVTRPQGRARIS